MYKTLKKIQNQLVPLTNYKQIRNEGKVFILNMKNRKMIYTTV